MIGVVVSESGRLKCDMVGRFYKPPANSPKTKPYLVSGHYGRPQVSVIGVVDSEMWRLNCHRVGRFF